MLPFLGVRASALPGLTKGVRRVGQHLDGDLADSRPILGLDQADVQGRLASHLKKSACGLPTYWSMSISSISVETSRRSGIGLPSSQGY